MQRQPFLLPLVQFDVVADSAESTVQTRMQVTCAVSHELVEFLVHAAQACSRNSCEF